MRQSINELIEPSEAERWEPETTKTRHQPVVTLVVLVGLSTALARFAVWAIGRGSGVWTLGVLSLAVSMSYLYVKWARRLIRQWVASPNLKLAMAVTMVMTVGGALVLDAGSTRNWWFVAGAAVIVLIIGLFAVDDLIQRLLGTRTSVTRSSGRSVRQVAVGARADRSVAKLAVVSAVVLATLIVLVGFVWWLAIAGIAWWLGVRVLERWLAGRHTDTVQTSLWWIAAVAACVGVAGLIVIAACDGSKVWFGIGVVAFLLAGIVLSRVVVMWLEHRTTRTRWLRLPKQLAEQQRQLDEKQGPPDHDDPIGEFTASAGGMAALMVAAALSALVGWWLHSRVENVSWSSTWLIVVGCSVLGAVPVMRGEAYLVAVVLAVATVWAVDDRSGSVQDWQPEPDAIPIVVLGDSFSSGEGASSYLDGTNVQGGNNCRRSPESYGVLVARALGRPLITFACSGADAAQIHRVGQVQPHIAHEDPPDRTTVTSDDGEPIRHTDHSGEIAGRRPQLDDLEADLTRQVDLVLLSIGGNDAMFGDIGRACVLPGSCKDIESDLQSNLIENVLREVDDALVAVALQYPNATVGVLAYPGALGSAPSIDDADNVCGQGAPRNAPLDEEEICVLRAFLTTLNDTVESAVDSAKTKLDKQNAPPHGRLVWIGGTEEAFDIEDATQDDPPINMLRLEPTDGVSVFERLNPTNWPHNSFHPTERGHLLLASAVLCGLAEVDGGEFVAPDHPCPDQAPGAEEHRVDVQAANETSSDAGVDVVATEGTRDAIGVTAIVTEPTVAPVGTDVPAVSASPARADYEKSVSRKSFGAATDSIRDVAFPYGLIVVMIGWLAALWGRFARAPEMERAG